MIKQMFVAGALALALTAPAFAGNTGSLSGTVVNRAGHPVAGATVQVRSLTDDLTTTTNSHGFFSFMTLNPATVFFVAMMPGYQSAAANIVITSDNTTQIQATLDRAGVTVGQSGLYEMNGVQFAAGMDTVFSALESVPGVVVSSGAPH